MNLEEQIELKEERRAKRAWMGIAIAAVIFLAGYAWLNNSTLHEAIIYQTYQPAFDGLANGSLKLELNSTYCMANTPGFTFNQTYNYPSGAGGT